jgi:hypothetical protein
MVDHDAPAATPAPGPAGELGPAELASISRTIAWDRRAGRATSTRAARNVELIVGDPRRPGGR